jgi:hypothetical protein
MRQVTGIASAATSATSASVASSPSSKTVLSEIERIAISPMPCACAKAAAVARSGATSSVMSTIRIASF